MTRFDITARGLHRLVAPVLPHASTDPEMPAYNAVRIESPGGEVVNAIATDRVTLAATRLQVDHIAPFGITVDREDLAAGLKVFKFTKDDNPDLKVVVDEQPVPVKHEGLHALALRIDAPDGTRLMLYDKTLPWVQPFKSWRKVVGNLIHRGVAPASPAQILSPSHMTRWAKAAARGERLSVFIGPQPGDSILVLVEDWFVGVWAPGTPQLDADASMLLTASPWHSELPSPLDHS
ncbi:hypothetical protein [Actinocorallia longicatena]|uniref:DNA polymerase III beta subunit-like protein n=1 Tax=Actinocorallia longicatena TaxID=111803 RepID=A0ABP6QHF8_9ACTN